MKTLFSTGQAGTGKTFKLKQRMLTDSGLVLAATTGIAAINLGEGITTIHSFLKFFDYESMKEKFEQGQLVGELRDRVEKGGLRTLAIDEVSMLDGRISDFLVETMGEVEELTGKELELIYTGDFCQLPPVKAPWVFESDSWPRFAEGTEKLTKIWRQDNEEFVNALNCFRSGNGQAGARILKSLPSVEWVGKIDENFEGTTIMAKNEEVDRYNLSKLARLPNQPWTVKSFRWAADQDRMKVFNPIPQSVSLKPEALVMLRANDLEEWSYANGSLGKVKDYNPETKQFLITLLNGKEVEVGMITRKQFSRETPERFEKLKEWEWPKNIQEGKEKGKGTDFSYWDVEARGGPKWVVAECSFYPLTLAWATTVHKSQGLTLDKVQIDLGPPNNSWHFMGSPAMVYVAMSRARSPEGLRIVGNPLLLSQRTKTDPKVKDWL